MSALIERPTKRRTTTEPSSPHASHQPSQLPAVRHVLRWAGSKSHALPHLVRLLPQRFGAYIEPMVGGGALFFALSPEQAILGDTNRDLINFYSALKRTPNDLKKRLLGLTASKRQYYARRNETPRGNAARAVRFAYLNRLAWNGLYRVNRTGQFNVPIGDRRPAILWNERDLDRAANSLQRARLVVGDFGVTLRKAQERDFVFLDPPYPRGARDEIGFNRYSADFFSLADHKRLARWVERLTSRGVYVMLTIAARSRLRAVYPVSLFQATLTTSALIAGDGSRRRRVRELILRNYRT